jgi:ethanolamine utilization protein EutM
MPGLIKDKALGLIETIGLVGAIEACDAAAKAADVVVSSIDITDPALVTLKIFGELGAVQAAVAAGSQAAERIGQLLSTHIIPNPDEGLDAIMSGSLIKSGKIQQKRKLAAVKPPTGSKPITDNSNINIAEIEKMKVTELRGYARTLNNLSIKGREISRADRDQLLREIKKSLGFE